jgi:hypothetical protein
MIRHIIVTSVWIAIWVLILVFDNSAAMSLNAWGDFLAGITAPLAFYWLIVGYFQQKTELNQNTQALRLQKEEMEKMAQHLGAQVQLLNIDYLERSIEKNIKELNAYPKLIKLRHTYISQRPVTLTIEFRNVGGFIYKIGVSGSAPGASRIMLKTPSYADNGGVIEIEIIANMNEQIDFLKYDFNLKINYVDGMNRKSFATLNWNANKQDFETENYENEDLNRLLGMKKGGATINP